MPTHELKEYGFRKQRPTTAMGKRGKILRQCFGCRLWFPDKYIKRVITIQKGRPYLCGQCRILYRIGPMKYNTLRKSNFVKNKHNGIGL